MTTGLCLETYSATNDILPSCQYSLTMFELPGVAHIFVGRELHVAENVWWDSQLSHDVGGQHATSPRLTAQQIASVLGAITG